jgi:LysR family transcriptional regulator, mexEF-oprN operon transcriptional activator
MASPPNGPRTVARDLDLNLLRVFVLVAEGGSVTGAASRLYLTQPAVSAALRRLADAVGAPLFSKHGRGLVLTPRGEQLLAETRGPLQALTRAALAPPEFAPATDETTFRIGLGDAFEGLLAPPLQRAMEVEAPRQRLVVLPVQFRTVGQAFATRAIDVALTVADELPRDVVREEVFAGSFVCLFDPRFVDLRVGRDGKVTELDYFAQEHVIVSYNGDLRGLVEDLFHGERARDVRCSLPSFTHVGALVEGSRLVATVPALVARSIQRARPRLRTAQLPFEADLSPTELLWPAATTDDPAHRFFRALVLRIAREVVGRMEATAERGAERKKERPR